MNKLLIPSILAATILVAGVFAFIPVEKAITVDQFIIAALTGDAGISNQDIIEELKDKLTASEIVAKAFLAEVEPLPEDLAGAVWCGFLRGLVAKAGGAPAHIHHGGTA